MSPYECVVARLQEHGPEVLAAVDARIESVARALCDYWHDGWCWANDDQNTATGRRPRTGRPSHCSLEDAVVAVRALDAPGGR